MTIQDIARANGMSLEEFYSMCWKVDTGYKHVPKNQIREDIRQLNTDGTVAKYVSGYLSLFTTNAHA